MRTINHLLNELIELHHDRILGFEKAVANIDDQQDGNSDLRRLFSEFIMQSREFSEELSVLVMANAGEPEKDGSVIGSLHRAWIDVKSLFSTANRQQILDEAERGEGTIKEAYYSIIEQGRMSGQTMEVLKRQCTSIESAYGEVNRLREQQTF